MKKMFVTTGTLIGIAALLYVVSTYRKQASNTLPVTMTPEQTLQKSTTLSSDNGTFCFVRTQVATESAPYASTEHITMTRAGDTITGTKSGTQSGPGVSNGFAGTITGSINGDAVTVVYAYTVEGSQGKEQEEYITSNTELIKHHYQLKEVGGILMPDKTKTERDGLMYTSEACV